MDSALQRKIDPELLALIVKADRGVAKKKAVKLDEEIRYEQDRHIAKVIYDTAKEALRKEKQRHKIAEAGFVVEKARHREERDRHLKAVAQFKVDAESWRLITRAEQEARRLKEIQDEGDHQATMARMDQRYKQHLEQQGVYPDDEDPIEVEQRRADKHTTRIRGEE